MDLDLIDKVGWQVASFITAIGLLIWIIRMTNSRMDRQHEEHREDREKDGARMESIVSDFRCSLKEISTEAKQGHEKVKSQLDTIEDYSRRTYGMAVDILDTGTKERQRIESILADKIDNQND